MSPKINFNFKYSCIYDQSLKGYSDVKINKKEVVKVKRILKIFESKKYYDEIISLSQLISKLTGLKWFEKSIDIYFTTKGISFSDPLTINILSKNLEQIKNILCHELIHRIFIQKSNTCALKPFWSYLKNKYPFFSQKTRNHIPLDAFITLIYSSKSFTLSRIKDDDKKMGADYFEAWQVVEREGYKKIIQEFKKGQPL